MTLSKFFGSNRGCKCMKIAIVTMSAVVLAVLSCEAFEVGMVDIHGFLSQGYLQSDNNNFYADTEEGTSQFNEVGINFSSDLTDRLRVGLQFLSRDLGDIGNNDVKLDWAYGSYRWKDWLQLEAGLLKIVWGLYNATRDIDMLRTPIFLPSSLYSERDREIYNSMLGVALGGDLYSSSLGSFSYSFAYGEEDVPTDSGFISGLDLDERIETLECTVKNIVSGNFEWSTPLEGLRLGVNLGQYDWDMKGRIMLWPKAGLGDWYPVEESINDARYLIASAEYTWNDLVLAAEYVTVNENEPQDTDDRDGHEHDRSEGFYGSVAYRFNEHFELGTYYSVNYPDVSDKDGKQYGKYDLPDYLAWQKELVVTTRFDINEHWLFKLEGHFVNGAANFILADNPQGLKKDSFLLAAKTTFNF